MGLIGSHIGNACAAIATRRVFLTKTSIHSGSIGFHTLVISNEIRPKEALRGKATFFCLFYLYENRQVIYPPPPPLSRHKGPRTLLLVAVPSSVPCPVRQYSYDTHNKQGQGSTCMPSPRATVPSSPVFHLASLYLPSLLYATAAPLAARISTRRHSGFVRRPPLVFLFRRLFSADVSSRKASSGRMGASEGMPILSLRTLNTVTVTLALGLVALAGWHVQNPGHFEQMVCLPRPVRALSLSPLFAKSCACHAQGCSQHSGGAACARTHL